MKKKQLLSGVMALLLSASLCACGGSKTAEGTSEAAGESSEAETSNTLSEGTPVPGGSVVYGMTQDLASLDPHVDTDAGTRDVVFNLYEGLVKPTSDGGFIPAVASDYTISDDHPVIVLLDHVNRIPLAEIVAVKKIHHLLISKHPFNRVPFPGFRC